MTAAAERAGNGRVGLRPATLDKEGRRNSEALEFLGQAQRRAGLGGAIRVLGVEGQGDGIGATTCLPWAQRTMPVATGCLGVTVYFSTPVITIPLVNTRWKMRNRMIGMIIVMRVPAWI